MPRPMKFWEVISAFRDRKDILEDVFRGSKWRDQYWDIFLNFDTLVARQDRQVLDALIPLELSQEIADRYPGTFFFDPEEKSLRTVKNHQRCTEMTAREVHDRFGGSVLEEVFEYGSAYPEKL